MQAYWTLVRRELGTHFLSWTGYVVVAAVLFLIGCSFVQIVQAMNSETIERPLTEVFFSSQYYWSILLLTTPLITMRCFAQEKATGTFETLMTAPVGDRQVVLAKFTGAMLFYMLMWLPLVACIFIVRHYTRDPSGLDIGTLAATFLGIFLLGGVYLSLGCLASALTRSQMVAAMISFTGGFALWLLSFLSLIFSGESGWQGRLFTHLGLIEHVQDFAHGVVDTRPVVFYLSVTFLFLFLTWKAVESRRWK